MTLIYVLPCSDSEWFGWYSQEDPTELVPLNQTRLYTEDWIGLRSLDQVHIDQALH